MDTITNDPVDILARTLWGEARGEGREGMEAVANVIVNRARNPRWWGTDITSVCLKPWQFSSWNSNDPNRPKMMAVDGSDPQFVTALVIADAAYLGRLPDRTDGADSYYAAGIPTPRWASHAHFTVQIGHQRFYRVEL